MKYCYVVCCGLIVFAVSTALGAGRDWSVPVRPALFASKMRNFNLHRDEKLREIELIRRLGKKADPGYQRGLDYLIDTSQDLQLFQAAIKVKLQTSFSFAELLTHSNCKVVVSTLKFGNPDSDEQESPKICGLVRNLAESHRDLSVRKNAFRFLQKVCLHENETQSFIYERYDKEGFPNVKLEILKAIANLVASEPDLLAVLEKIEKFRFDLTREKFPEDLKSVLALVPVLDHGNGLSTLFDRTSSADDKVVLPAAYLSGRWGLFGLREIILAHNSTPEVYRAAEAGVSDGGPFAWDSIFDVEEYITALNSGNAPLAELAALVLRLGNKMDLATAKRVTTAANSTLARVAAFQVTKQTKVLPLAEIYPGLQARSAKTRIETIELLLVRCAHLKFEDYGVLEAIRTRIAACFNDEDDAVRLAAVKALDNEKLKCNQYPALLAAIGGLLDDENDAVRRSAATILARKSLKTFYQGKAQGILSGESDVESLDSKLAQMGTIDGALRTAAIATLTADDVRHSKIRARLVDLASTEYYGEHRAAALKALALAGVDDGLITKVLLPRFGAEKAPAVAAVALRLVRDARIGDVGTVLLVAKALNKITRHNQKDAMIQVLRDWDFAKFDFRADAGQKRWTDLFNGLVGCAPNFSTDLSKTVIVEWLDRLVAIVQDRLTGDWEIDMAELNRQFLNRDFRIGLMPVYARLFTAIPKIVQKNLAKIVGRDNSTLAVGLILSGNLSRGDGSPLTAVDANTIEQQMKVFEESSGLPRGHLEISELGLFLIYLRHNHAPQYRTRLLERLSRLATRIRPETTSESFKVLLAIMDDVTIDYVTRQNAAQIIVNAQIDSVSTMARAREFLNDLRPDNPRGCETSVAEAANGQV